MNELAMMLRADPSFGAGPRSRPILEPGRNCWRIPVADRAAVLIDGAAYFQALDSALRRARRSVLILGWDFDGRIRLRGDEEAEGSDMLGPLLRRLVEENSDLVVRILVWVGALVHPRPTRRQLLLHDGWMDHPRIRVKLAPGRPIYAAQHQKVVCIDGRLAFVGGIDLTVQRWDTGKHIPDDPRRTDPDGKTYPPIHDVQMAVDGEAAEALTELAAEHWRAETGEAFESLTSGEDPWPLSLAPLFRRCPVAISRGSAWARLRPTEVAALTTDAIRAAKSTIYIESQYMTGATIGDRLVERLQEPNGPEIVVVMAFQARSLIEHLTMGTNRDRLIRRLSKADRFGRLRIYYPCIPGDGHIDRVFVHSKLMIVDDRFLRIGSSNLNNRSMGLDLECDLALEAQDGVTRRTIAGLRSRLVAEHLCCDPRQVHMAVAQAQSLIGAIERLNQAPRTMRAFDAMSGEGPSRPAPGTRLFDPYGPFTGVF